VGQGLALTVSNVPASQLLTVQLSQAAATLTTGAYSGIVVINAGGLQATISVTISVNGGAGSVLTVSPGSLAFAYQNGGQLTLIPVQTLVTTSPTGSSFTATATSDKGWLFLDANAQGDIPGKLQVYAVIPQGGLTAGLIPEALPSRRAPSARR